MVPVHSKRAADGECEPLSREPAVSCEGAGGRSGAARRPLAPPRHRGAAPGAAAQDLSRWLVSHHG
ncbi:hypothetical protein GCM10027074_44870 [Streptomyces deserti]